MQVHFYDSAEPDNIPSGVYGAVYINGFKWDQEDISRMKRIIRVSVEQDAMFARIARCLDVERGAGRPVDLPPFAKERLAMGYDDCTAYVNRSNWQECYERIVHAGLPQPLWWVATLDGTQQVNPPVPGCHHAWAVQFETVAGYDLSILHGVNNFVRP